MAEVDRAELYEALKLVKPGLANRELIEQATSFLLLDGKVMTYNDEISVSHPVESLAGFRGAVSAYELYNLLDQIKRDTIVIEQTENEIRISAGKTIEAGLSFESEIKLPVEDLTRDKEWRELPDGFKDALETAVYSCSKDVSQPALTGVHIDGTLIESSDNVRLSQVRLSEEVPFSPLLIPWTSVEDLIGYDLKEIGKDDKEGWVHFRTAAGTTISCRLIEARYPDTSRIADVQGTEIELPRRLIDVLQRAKVFAKREHLLDEEVEVELSDKQMTIKGHSEAGWFREKIRLKYDGKPASFSVHPRFLNDICERTNVCVLSDNRMKFSNDNWLHIIALKNR